MKRTLPLLLTLLCSWTANLDEGLERSRIEKRPLLLVFTASDWSGWSMKFKDEVLSSDRFKEKLSELVCVEIDSPLHAMQAKEVERFGVTEFPTTILLSVDQREIARLGYLPMTAEQMADDLLFTLAQDRDLSYLLDLIARGERTQSILEKAYHLAAELCNEGAIASILECGIQSREPGYFLVEKYRRTQDLETKERLIELDDPDLLYHVALLDFQEKPGVESLEEFLESYGERAAPYRWQLEMMISQYYLEQDRLDEAIQHGELAQENAPQAHRHQITHSLDYMRSVER